MSINGMNTLGLARASTGGGVRSDDPERQAIFGAATTPDGGVVPTVAPKPLEELARYIPTEAVTMYLALLGVVGVASGGFTGRWIAFAIFAIATPLMVWVDWEIKVRSAVGVDRGKTRRFLIFNAVAAMLAFAALGFALPASPFSQFQWYDPKWGGFAALVVPYLLTKGEALFLPPTRKPGR